MREKLVRGQLDIDVGYEWGERERYCLTTEINANCNLILFIRYCM